MRAVYFKNKGLLSLIDLTTMGDSSKREDNTKIGKFDSCLKYAIALLHRNKIDFEIHSGNSKFTVETTTITDKVTKKAKEVMMIIEEKILDEPTDNICNNCQGTNYGEHSNNSQFYQCDGNYCKEALEENPDVIEHVTGFSPQLGYNWELWQAIREIKANNIDEQGTVNFVEDGESFEWGAEDETTFIISANPLIEDIINHWNDYFLSDDLESIYKDYSLTIYKNPNHTLKLYKQGILIYKDEKVKSRYIYSWNGAKIDERRILVDLYDFKRKITAEIEYCKNEEFLEDFMSNNDSDMFEHSLDFYSISSDTLIQVANRLYKENKLFVSKNLKDAISSNEKSDIGILKLKHTTTYDYSRVDVEPIVHNAPQEIKEEIKETFESKIVSIAEKFNIKVEYPIIEAKISGFTVMADSFRKTLFVSDTFQEENLWELVKAIYSLNKDKDKIYKDFIILNQ